MGDEPTVIGQFDEDDGPSADETVIGAGQQPACASSAPAAPTFAAPLSPAPPGATPDEWIGPYRILEKLGQGGMGTVYRAEQFEPVRRHVAIKIIRAGMDTGQVIARFEAERQALAMMDHTSIARVYEGGATPAGLPYFVMELVKGEPITEFCDTNRLSINERLQLFAQVCNAVQHAHQKGIIHRDLKPSNILVTRQDGTPVPKVIDFGLAKPTDQRLTEHTMLTAHGQILGTPEYMSPEQAEMTDLDVDTRTDVYALGVVLYELLTGSTPLKRETLLGCGFIEVLKRIREEEAESPSSRIKDSCETLELRSTERQLEPRRFALTIKGDLDWIVLKAIEKDRSRRYGTATELAADIRRFLNDEPVEACPPTTGYRMHKWIRRNRIAFGFITTVAALLVVGIGVSTYLAVWALREAAAASVAALEATAARDRETTARLIAEDERQAARVAERQAREVLGVVTDSFKSISPDEGAVYDMPASEALRRAFSQLDTRLTDDPIARAAVLHTLSSSFSELGRYSLAVQTAEEAVRLRKESLGKDNRETLASSRQLSRAHRQSGEYREALELAEQTFQLSEQTFGNNDPDTLQAMHTLAAVYYSQQELDKAVPLLTKTLDLRRSTLGDNDPDTLRSMHALAAAYYRQRDWPKAIALHQKALAGRRSELGEDHPATLQSMCALAASHAGNGQLDEAVALYSATLDRQQIKLGDDHPDTLRTMSTLAAAYAGLGQLNTAIPLYEKALAQQEIKLGDAHPDTLWTMHSLATRYYEKGNLDKAILLYQRALEHQRITLGSDHPDTLHSMHNLGTMYLNSGVTERGRTLLEECLTRREATLGPQHANTLDTMNNLANAFLDTGETDRAIELLRSTVEIRKATVGDDHERTLLAMNNLARAYARSDHLPELIALRREILVLQKATLGDHHTRTLATIFSLAQAFHSQGNLHEAIALLEEALAGRRTTLGDSHLDTRATEKELAVARAERTAADLEKRLGGDHPDTLLANSQLALALADKDDFAKAISLFEQTLTRQTEILGEDHPDRLSTVFHLADTHYGSGNLDQAIAMHEEALEKRRAVLGNNSDDTFMSVRKLAICYQRQGDAEKAKPLCEAIVQRQRETLGPEDPATLKSISQLAVVCLKTDESDRAAAMQNRVLAVRKKQLAIARRKSGNLPKALRYGSESEQKYRLLKDQSTDALADVFDAGAMAFLQAEIHSTQGQPEEAHECRKRALDDCEAALYNSADSPESIQRLQTHVATLLRQLPDPPADDREAEFRNRLLEIRNAATQYSGRADSVQRSGTPSADKRSGSE